jgi:hypothetical protein
MAADLNQANVDAAERVLQLVLELAIVIALALMYFEQKRGK